MAALSVRGLEFRYALPGGPGAGERNTPRRVNRGRDAAPRPHAGKTRPRYAPDRPALRGVDLELERGEFLLVCGASGAGKSTLCRTLNGLIPQFHRGTMRGSVVVDGLNTREHAVGELFGAVGIVLQQPSAQFFCGTVFEELAYGAESLGLPPPEIRTRVREAAETVGVADLLRRKPHELSGGEQQLALIAAMLVARPRVLVLDEPYAHLDSVGVKRVSTALREAKRRGTAVVVSEHRLDQAIVDADRVLVLQDGAVAALGDRDRVLRLELERFGVTRPPVVHAALARGLPRIPLTVHELAARSNFATRGGRDSGDSRRSQPADGTVAGSEPRSDPERRAGAAPVRPSSFSGGAAAREIVRIRGLYSSIDRREVLRDLNLSVYEGECLAVVGANGSGKTTMARHLLGLGRPQRGEVRVAGLDAARTRPSVLASHVGLAFQVPDNQFFRFTVAEEIAAGAEALNRLDESWIGELIERFELGRLRDRSPFTLSGGEKKRVGFAAALASRPELLVLDEPTAGQDAGFRATLSETLADLTRHGQTVMLITHDLPFAERHADRWAVMSGGSIIAEGAPDEIMAREAVMRDAQLAPTQHFLLGEPATGELKPIAKER